MAAGEASATKPRQEKQYDYLLKFLLVGDSDVGKQEILSGLEDGAAESPFCSGNGIFSNYPVSLFLEVCVNYAVSWLADDKCKRVNEHVF